MMTNQLPIEYNTVSDVKEGCQIFREAFKQLKHELSNVIVGNSSVIDLVLVAIFADGHVLLEGPPGLGKTLLVETLSNTLNLTHARIQCTADLMPADVVGTTIVDEHEYTGKREFRFERGPVFCQLLLVDEINRATPKCQSSLLESMQERSVSVDGVTHALPTPFFVLATQNPIEQEGTYPLPEAQLDRFMFKINVKHSNQNELNEILNRTTSDIATHASTVIDAEFVTSAQAFLKNITISGHVQDYVARLILATHADSEYAPHWIQDEIQIGVSPRASQAIVSSAKVVSVINGRYAVSIEDINTVAVSALQHRMTRTFEAQTAFISEQSIIERLIDEIEIYKDDWNE